MMRKKWRVLIRATLSHGILKALCCPSTRPFTPPARLLFLLHQSNQMRMKLVAPAMPLPGDPEGTALWGSACVVCTLPQFEHFTLVNRYSAVLRNAIGTQYAVTNFKLY